MTWTVKLNSSAPAVIDANNPANIDVTFLASHTDGRTLSFINTNPTLASG